MIDNDKQKNNLVMAALIYADLGWSVIPIQPDKKAPCIKWKSFQNERATKEQVRTWWKRYPEARIGVVTGKISDLVVVDFDSQEARPSLENAVGKLPVSIMQKTGRGFHAFFKYPVEKNGFKTCSNYNGLKGVDLKADGGYIIVAPSPYDSEKYYKWENINPAVEGTGKLSGMTKEMVRFFNQDSDKTSVSNKRPSIDGVQKGERDNAVFNYARSLKKKGLTLEEAEILVLEKAKNCQPPFSINEAIKCLKSAYNGKNDGCSTPSFVENLNKKHFVSRDGGKTLVFNEEHDHVLNRKILTSSSFTHFREFYSNEYVLTAFDSRGIPKKQPKGTAWLNHQERRQYDGIILDPKGDHPGFYNLWKGWPLSPKKGDWSLLDDHIKENICQGKADLYEYIIKWLAFAVQHPDKPSEVALVMRGKRGVGKSILGKLFGKLFGQNFLHIFSGKHLTGDFNSHLRDCIFLFADEAFWAGDKRGEGVLKGLITEPTLVIEPKGKDVVITKNMLHVMMASNSDWVAPSGLDERRFFIADVGEQHKQDQEYFRLIQEQMDNGGYSAMLHDLLQMDLVDFEIRNVPDTEGLREQKIFSMDPIQAWWFHILCDSPLPSTDGDWGVVIKTAVYDHYIKAAGKAGVSYRGMQTTLGMKLAKLLPAQYPITKKIEAEVKEWDKNLETYITEMKRVPHWVFPPLKECREYFEKISNMQGYDWPEAPEASEIVEDEIEAPF